MKRGRIGVVLVLIVSLLVAGGARDLARSRRGVDPDLTAGGGGTNLSSMNSFALALLLGGLRGPLVMMLWSSSESQKAEKNLEDFDTKVEWIRLLQPEFDTVHIFQIWNKAYNISVMMASLANKYITILDALDYAHKADQQRPHDINIIYAIGGIYFDKFGTAAEKAYYRKRVRDETRPHPTRQKQIRGDQAVRPLELEPLIDETGKVLPKYLRPTCPPMVDDADPKERYDGSELQFLKQYEPFMYGVSPFALAYNYQKRAQILQAVAHQRHAQLSSVVVDSRPPLALMFWAQEEMERARKLELQAYGKAVPTERLQMEAPTESISPDVPMSDSSGIAEAIYSYGRAAQLGADSLKEFERHIKSPTYALTINNYQSLMEGVAGLRELCLADQAYLQAATSAADKRGPLLKAAAEHYQKSLDIHRLMLLTYYTNEIHLRSSLPPSVQSLAQLKPDQYAAVLGKAKNLLAHDKTIPPAEDRQEYDGYVERAEARLKRL